MASMPHLEEIIQRLYDSEINLTITMLWDGDFAFASYMEFHVIGTPVADLQSLVNHRPGRTTSTPWHNCRSAHVNLQRPFMKPRSTNILNWIMRKPTGVRISNQRTFRAPGIGDSSLEGSHTARRQSRPSKQNRRDPHLQGVKRYFCAMPTDVEGGSL
jgi:hypothetical protein